MRILFVGGKDIGCGCLEYLISESQSEIIYVFPNKEGDTAKDRWYRSVVEIALENDIPIYKPKSINSPETVKRIQDLSPDLIIIVYYDQILKEQVIKIPKCGCINLHMALAEEYRGCYPTTWALINGEKKTGVTLHYIDKGIDTGSIIAQRKIDIGASDTGKSLYYKCTELGISLFKETFPLIEKGVVPRKPQITTANTKYYKRVFPSREVDFSKSEEEIRNFIRALSFPPFPPPYFYIGNRKMIIVEDKE